MIVTAASPQSLRPPPSDQDLRSLLLIRHFELALLRLFEQGAVSGTTHTCLGQEYVPVALAPLLLDEDFVFSNHRGHGHFLARHAEPYGLLAEIMGREGALCGGVGGSQHVYHRRFLSTGVQGESLPVATGVALKLAGTIGARAAAFGVRHHRITSTDVEEIRAELAPLSPPCAPSRRRWSPSSSRTGSARTAGGTTRAPRRRSSGRAGPTGTPATPRPTLENPGHFTT
ncbi:thiamine pyrophosphate-dependent enzyme [Microtetraspora malaysiensis]|uniref:thiamine pyrophosphate-dependent enzyme n=1 Tax=Microtetraspora malaysiensis TaxID=161358 RepID=UPI003D8E3155